MGEAELLAALAGAVVGAVFGAVATAATQALLERRRERRTLVYRIKGLRRLLGQLVNSRITSQAAQRLQEALLAAGSGDRAFVMQEASSARGFSQQMVIEGERVKRELIEAIAAIPHTFRMDAGVRSAVDAVFDSLHMVANVKRPPTGLAREELDAWYGKTMTAATADVEAMVERPIDALLAHLEPQLR